MNWLKSIVVFALSLAAVNAAVTFTNPIKAVDGSDPFMVYDNGYYYLMTTTWNNVQVRNAYTVPFAFD